LIDDGAFSYEACLHIVYQLSTSTLKVTAIRDRAISHLWSLSDSAGSIQHCRARLLSGGPPLHDAVKEKDTGEEKKGKQALHDRCRWGDQV
jgi:hypothetical protein